MLRDAKEAPAIVYFFADNLDAALAAGEVLLNRAWTGDQAERTSAEATAERLHACAAHCPKRGRSKCISWPAP